VREVTNKESYRIAVLLGIVLAASAAPLRSSQDNSEKGTFNSLKTVSAAPKNQVMIPLSLTLVPPETQVGRIAATIGFENRGVSFLRVEKAFSLDGVNGSFQAEVQKDANDLNKSILHLEVFTKGEPRKALRDGLVLYLVFQIEADASPGIAVALDFQKIGASNLDDPPKAIEPLVGKNGVIEVLNPENVPYVSCFFFTH
jgi:hypothetical protein